MPRANATRGVPGREMKSISLEGRRWLVSAVGFLAATVTAIATPADYFAIQVVDEATGRGVPLVQLETVHQVSFWTDSNGVVAINEPDLMGRTVFFQVRSHGYEFPKDGFGFAGTRLDVRAGATAELKLRRINVAERLYRITGEGIYRDSLLLDRPVPIKPNNGQVAGQDSAMALPYGGQLYWFWGDTARLEYPLGNFHSSGASAPLPGPSGNDPSAGLSLKYFAGPEGFSRGMWPVPKTGRAILVWPDGFLTAPDATGRERMLAHYTHLYSLTEPIEHGLGIFDDEAQEFRRIKKFPDADTWRFPKGHPSRGRGETSGYWLFRATRYDHSPFLVVRVRASLEEIQEPAKYEAFTCLRADGEVDRDAAGKPRWAWRHDAEPMTQKREAALVRAGKLAPDDARFQLEDVDTHAPVFLHAGSVRWNDFRKRWVLISSQDGPGKLGETWYAEAAEPTGPWRHARKVVTHDRQSFYNPVHHEFLNQEGGRLIYFEGTYTRDFSGNPEATPRYNYNQIMYRLDLADPRLDAAR